MISDVCVYSTGIRNSKSTCSNVLFFAPEDNTIAFIYFFFQGSKVLMMSRLSSSVSYFVQFVTNSFNLRYSCQGKHKQPLFVKQELTEDKIMFLLFFIQSHRRVLTQLRCSQVSMFQMFLFDGPIYHKYLLCILSICSVQLGLCLGNKEGGAKKDHQERIQRTLKSDSLGVESIQLCKRGKIIV